MKIALLTLTAYLIGSIPFGLLIARLKGVDIRKEGSGNIGATNVLRVIGKRWGIFTLFLDILKGFIPAFFFAQLLNLDHDWRLLFGAAAILGHTFPIYLKFKGGKGVATSAGMLLGVAPVAMGVGFIAWGVCMAISRYVSLSSIVASFAIATTIWVRKEYQQNIISQVVITLLCLLVIWLHRANIKRILNGTESKMGRQKEKKS
jgi:glycerol-3-phosphate acyltransferase PlsY